VRYVVQGGGVRACPTCGMEWDDGVTVCPTDDTLLAVTGLALDDEGVATGLALPDAVSAPGEGAASSAPRSRLYSQAPQLASFLFDSRLHPFFLLGAEAEASFEGHREQVEACGRFLQRERQRPDSEVGLFASRVLDDPRMVAARGWDASAWAAEPERYRRARPEWFQLTSTAELFVVDGRLSAEEIDSLSIAAARVGMDRPALLGWLAQTYPSVTVDTEQKIAFHLRLHDGTRVTSTGALREVALRGAVEWQAVAASLAELRARVDGVDHPDGMALAAAIDIANERFPVGGGAAEQRAAPLRLEYVFRRLGWDELRLPKPWSPGGLRAIGDIVSFAAGDAERLVPAALSGRLLAWLLGVPGGVELSGLLERVNDEASARRASWALMWRLGEIRFRLGSLVVASHDDVRAALLRTGPVLRALQDGTLRDWANHRGFVALSSAVDAAIVEPVGLIRLQALRWRIGDDAYDAHITGPEDVVAALLRDPARMSLIDDPSFRAWVRARGGRVPDVGSAQRRMHEALWSLGVEGLFVAGAFLRDRTKVVSVAATGGPAAARVLHALQPFVTDGLLGEFLSRAEVPFQPTGDVALDVRVALWSLGWTAFHCSGSGFRTDPPAVAAWADDDPASFDRKLQTGWVVAWLERAWPEVAQAVADARENPSPSEFEAICRALGAPRPRVVVDDPVVVFGDVAEGAIAAQRVVLHNAGPRGLAAVELRGAPEMVEVAWAFGPREANARRMLLRPGQSAGIQVTFAPPVGKVTRLSGDIELAVDGAPLLIELQAESLFDLQGFLVRVIVGAVVGAVVLGGARFVLHSVSGGAYVAADGSYVADVWRVDPSRGGGLGTALWVTLSSVAGAVLLALGLARRYS
jgi:hypothetical protein